MEIKLPKIKLPKLRLSSAVACFVAAGALLALTFFNFSLSFQLKPSLAKLLGLPETLEARETAKFEKEVLPVQGVILPVKWGDLGAQMIKSGVIDADKFEDVYKNQGGLNEEIRRLLYDSGNGNIKITKENAGVLLNLLWALGLGNKNT